MRHAALCALALLLVTGGARAQVQVDFTWNEGAGQPGVTQFTNYLGVRLNIVHANWSAKLTGPPAAPYSYTEVYAHAQYRDAGYNVVGTADRLVCWQYAPAEWRPVPGDWVLDVVARDCTTLGILHEGDVITPQDDDAWSHAMAPPGGVRCALTYTYRVTILAAMMPLHVEQATVVVPVGEPGSW